MMSNPKDDLLQCIGVLRSVFEAERVSIQTIEYLNFIVNNLPDMCEYDVSILDPIYSHLEKMNNLNLGIKLVYGLDVSI